MIQKTHTHKIIDALKSVHFHCTQLLFCLSQIYTVNPKPKYKWYSPFLESETIYEHTSLLGVQLIFFFDL